ncbi:PREDICTED: lignin-forming anionic peroxidase-like [Ipomoea nil]|uniref:lignin-forming anionic peroxidase-like n=1 Tax=Ipomoea nil TaxID=35883 RepID=UPI00090089FC|nr:PREDICTED: lignin-forming anionic peroxidase-like [Ipomoea nil]
MANFCKERNAIVKTANKISTLCASNVLNDHVFKHLRSYVCFNRIKFYSVAEQLTVLFQTLSCLLLLLLSSSFSQCQAQQQQLSPTFYDNTCPNALNIIRDAVRQAVSRCDASILLDESPTIKSEKTALPNHASARGYDVIEAAKRELEKLVLVLYLVLMYCRWLHVMPLLLREVRLGHFATKGLNTRDMVALSGAHTLGQAQCFLFRDRIYGNRTDIDAGFASTRRRKCPKDTGNGNWHPLI